MLRWAFLLFTLSLIEGLYGSHHRAATAISTVSFILAIGLVILVQRHRKPEAPKVA